MLDDPPELHGISEQTEVTLTKVAHCVHPTGGPACVIKICNGQHKKVLNRISGTTNRKDMPRTPRSQRETALCPAITKCELD